MSEVRSKRNLQAFLVWVENGPDRDETDMAQNADEYGGCDNGCLEGEAPGDAGSSAAGNVSGNVCGSAAVHTAAAGSRGKNAAGRTMERRFMEFTEEHALRIFGNVYRTVSQVVCLAGMAVLLMMVSHLPPFGAADNPANNEVVSRYLEKGLAETGAVNTVAGIILDYRAFDTFGESVVLFLAATSVIALMRRRSGRERALGGQNQAVGEPGGEPKHDIILEQVSRLLVPFILMFGIYVVLNGHLSPGGGFSGGTVMGAGLILYANAFGYRRIHRFFHFRTFTAVSSSALMVYAFSKGYSFFMGANHLESGIPLGSPGHILSAGLILPLDICVGLVVAGTMYCFYSLFREGEV